jgi:hypothetical protein
MRTRLSKQAILRHLIDAVEANGTFPKVYAIKILPIGTAQEFNWIAVFSSPGVAHPGYGDAFSAIASEIAKDHDLLPD